MTSINFSELRETIKHAVIIYKKHNKDYNDLLNSYTNLTVDEKNSILTELNLPTLTMTIEQAKKSKINELSQICKKKIEDGITIPINGVQETFSFSIENGDQENIATLFELARATGLNQPYHNNGGTCKLYTPDQISDIYVANTSNKLQQTTYFNQMKMMIENEYNANIQMLEEDESYIYSDDYKSIVNNINAIKYGDPLTGIYLENYNAIITQCLNIAQSMTSSTSTLSFFK